MSSLRSRKNHDTSFKSEVISDFSVSDTQQLPSHLVTKLIIVVSQLSFFVITELCSDVFICNWFDLRTAQTAFYKGPSSTPLLFLICPTAWRTSTLGWLESRLWIFYHSFSGLYCSFEQMEEHFYILKGDACVGLQTVSNPTGQQI